MVEDVTIESADNGYLVRCYEPGGPKKEGKTRRAIAGTPEQAAKLAVAKLKKGKTKGKAKSKGGGKY